MPPRPSVLFALLLFSFTITPILALHAPPPRVAVAPIAREYLEMQERSGESLTPLLLAGLSDDPRWTLVERADLGPLESEWALGGSAGDHAALAVAQGRLLGADWSLLLHPDLRSPENPLIRIEIVDTIRSEPLCIRHIPLIRRPRARWFRNPPGEDFETVLAACKDALAESLSVREARAQTRVAALMFFRPEIDSPPASVFEANLQAHIVSLAREAAAQTTAPGEWRFMESPDPAVAHGEYLLRTAGFIGEQTPAALPVDALICGLYRAVTPNILNLRFWIWSEQRETQEYHAQGDANALATAILTALSTSSSPNFIAADSSHALARRLVEEARTLAPNAHWGSSEAEACHRLLALAALLEPADREIQELRLIAAEHALRDGPDASTNRTRIGLEYARLADHYWRGADGHVDLRLLATSFLGASYTLPGQRERALRVAPVLLRAAAADLGNHVALFERWHAYCHTPDAQSFALLEVALPVIARYRPEELTTKLNGSVGIIPDLLETYRDNNRTRLLALVDRLPRSQSAPDPMADAADRLIVVDSPKPELNYPRNYIGQ